MKRLIIITSFIFLFKCAKEDQRALNNASVEIKNKYTLDVSAGEGGSVSQNGGEYEEGIEIQITAIPDNGYIFDGWSDGNNEITRVIELKEDLKLVANFTLITYSFFDNINTFIMSVVSSFISFFSPPSIAVQDKGNMVEFVHI